MTLKITKYPFKVGLGFVMYTVAFNKKYNILFVFLLIIILRTINYKMIKSK